MNIDQAIAVDRARHEILADMGTGVLPDTVGSFSELHQYVDANTYGGLCDDDCPDGLWEPESVAVIQDAVDAWLRQRATFARYAVADEANAWHCERCGMPMFPGLVHSHATSNDRINAGLEALEARIRTN